MIRGPLLLLAVACLIAAGAFYFAALERVRPWFPPEFREADRVNVALDYLIWDRSFPAEARRKYLLSTVFGAAFFFCVTCLLYLEDQLVGAVGFACLFMGAIAYVFMRFRKYRDRL
jgi:hypothetical protein